MSKIEQYSSGELRRYQTSVMYVRTLATGVILGRLVSGRLSMVPKDFYLLAPQQVYVYIFMYGNFQQSNEIAEALFAAGNGTGGPGCVEIKDVGQNMVSPFNVPVTSADATYNDGVFIGTREIRSTLFAIWNVAMMKEDLLNKNILKQRLGTGTEYKPVYDNPSLDG